jgi:hypothetical protein
MMSPLSRTDARTDSTSGRNGAERKKTTAGCNTPHMSSLLFHRNEAAAYIYENRGHSIKHGYR